MRNLKSKKLNNKGFSFLLVIVAMSFVAILVAIMLLVSYQNFQMKHTGLKSEDNFYTAEQVLDEIKAGLQTDISASVSEAYTYVLERYSETDGQDVTRNWYFQTKYVDTLRGKVLGSASNNTYNLELLKSYVQKADDKGTVELSMEGTEGTLVTNYNTGVTLKGLTVTYTDNRGFVSIISTDLRLSIPVIDFTQSSSSPDLLKYCIIADDGILVAGSSAQTFTGNVYAGDNGLQVGVGVTSEPSLSINSERTIVKDGIDVNQNSSLSFVGNALWTDSIDLMQKANLNVNANIFVKDDLTLEGAESSATLAGRYYGFSNPTMVTSSNAYKHMADELPNDPNKKVPDAKVSSAIIINGKNSNLNLANINSLFIAGNSYINAKLGFEGENPMSIQMGESISSKGNQLAYLAPENAIVVTGADNIESGNPIVGLPSADEVQVSLNVDVRLNELGGRRLRDLGFTSEDCQVYYAQGIAYVYMKFESDIQAANYFNAYNKTDINKYKEMFAKQLVINNTMSNVTLNGSIYEQKLNTIDSQASLSSATMEANGYQDMFFAFCKKLVSTYTTLSADETLSSSTVFTNLVDVQAMTDYLRDNNTSEFVYTTPGEETAYKAILVNGPYTITKAVDEKTRLIVATGDVTLSEDFDFKGLVICGGEFTVSGGATVTAVPEEVSAAFQCIYYKDNEGQNQIAEKSPMNFFKEGQKFMLDGIASGIVSGSAGSLIDLSDIIIYENWKKQ